MSSERGFVSTGRLPDASVVQRAIEAVHELYRANGDGRNAQVYPALARADPTRFGVCFVSVTGDAFSAGDADVEFTNMSVAKPFVFALVCQASRRDWRPVGMAAVLAAAGTLVPLVPTFRRWFRVELLPAPLDYLLVLGAVALWVGALHALWRLLPRTDVAASGTSTRG